MIICHVPDYCSSRIWAVARQPAEGPGSDDKIVRQTTCCNLANILVFVWIKQTRFNVLIMEF